MAKLVATNLVPADFVSVMLSGSERIYGVSSAHKMQQCGKVGRDQLSLIGRKAGFQTTT